MQERSARNKRCQGAAGMHAAQLLLLLSRLVLHLLPHKPCCRPQRAARLPTAPNAERSKTPHFSSMYLIRQLHINRRLLPHAGQRGQVQQQVAMWRGQHKLPGQRLLQSPKELPRAAAPLAIGRNAPSQRVAKLQ